jgi:dihydroorotate dehydrogenase (NAD+) catalytic subunit
MTVDLSTRVGSLMLANPVMTASGTFGYGLDLADLCPPERLGAIVTKGLSPRPRRGNQPPRIIETPAGMINAIGLQNIGVEAFCSLVLPELSGRGAVVVVNVFGENPEAYLEVIGRCEAASGIAAYELNVSCPNVSAGGIEFGHEPALLERLTGMCRRATAKPLWVKLSPNAPDLVGTAHAAVAGGADGLTLINTIKAMAVDPVRRRPVLSRGFGGLSGPAIKPIALRMVSDVHRALPEIPLVGIGGALSGRDVVEFLLVGASAVQVGTAVFREPGAPLRIVAEIESFCADNGVAAVSDLVGALRWD